MRLFASSPEVGVDRIITLALSTEYEGVTGKFIYEDYIKDPNPEALDNKIAQKVWEISKQHVGI